MYPKVHIAKDKKKKRLIFRTKWTTPYVWIEVHHIQLLHHVQSSIVELQI